MSNLLMSDIFAVIFSIVIASIGTYFIFKKMDKDVNAHHAKRREHQEWWKETILPSFKSALSQKTDNALILEIGALERALETDAMKRAENHRNPWGAVHTHTMSEMQVFTNKQYVLAMKEYLFEKEKVRA